MLLPTRPFKLGQGTPNVLRFGRNRMQGQVTTANGSVLEKGPADAARWLLLAGSLSACQPRKSYAPPGGPSRWVQVHGSKCRWVQVQGEAGSSGGRGKRGQRRERDQLASTDQEPSQYATTIPANGAVRQAEAADRFRVELGLAPGLGVDSQLWLPKENAPPLSQWGLKLSRYYAASFSSAPSRSPVPTSSFPRSSSCTSSR